MGVCDEAVKNKAIWEDNTTLIIGDSMLYGLEENKLKRKTKILKFRGSTIETETETENIILHVGTNNCVQDNSDQVVDKLIKLKLFINSILPMPKVILSSLITSLDNAKVRLTVLMVNKKSLI